MSGYVPRKLRDRSGVTRSKTSRERAVTVEKDEAPKKSSKTTPKSGAKRRPSPRGGTAPRRPSPKSRSSLAGYKREPWSIGEWRHMTFLLSLIALAAVLLAGVTWVGSGNSGLQLAGLFGRSTGELADARKDARTAAAAMFSYDYRNFGDSVKNGQAHTTGYFSEEYAKTTKKLKKTVVKEEATVESEVVDVATVEADATCSPKKGPSYDGGIEFLAFVNQTTKNKNIEGSRIDKSRVVMCMVYTESGWKTADAKAI